MMTSSALIFVYRHLSQLLQNFGSNHKVMQIKYDQSRPLFAHVSGKLIHLHVRQRHVMAGIQNQQLLRLLYVHPLFILSIN